MAFAKLFSVSILFMLLLLDRSAALPLLPDVLEDDGIPGAVYYNSQNTSQGSPFLHNVETIVNFFLENNPPNGYVTSLGYGNAPDTAYGHSGCYNMSAQSNCSMCLRQCYNNIQQVAPLALGAAHWINDTGLGYLCRLRFEAYSFKVALLGVIGPNGSVAPAPAPAIAPNPSSRPVSSAPAPAVAPNPSSRPVSAIAPDRPVSPSGPVTPVSPVPPSSEASGLTWGLVGSCIGFAFFIIGSSAL